MTGGARHEVAETTGGRGSENGNGEASQAIAELTLVRSCPTRSLAPVLAIMTLVAAASREAG